MANIVPPFQNDAVADKFSTYPTSVAKQLLQLRQLIFEVAPNNADIGAIEETLKWGEPSYLPIKRNVGTTIRMDWKAKTPNNYYLFFNCKTTLIDTFKEIYSDTFKYEGNRSLVFSIEDALPISELKDCFAIALTYHLLKKK